MAAVQRRRTPAPWTEPGRAPKKSRARQIKVMRRPRAGRPGARFAFQPLRRKAHCENPGARDRLAARPGKIPQDHTMSDPGSSFLESVLLAPSIKEIKKL